MAQIYFPFQKIRTGKLERIKEKEKGVRKMQQRKSGMMKIIRKRKLNPESERSFAKTNT